MNIRLIVLFLIASLLITACGGAADSNEANQNETAAPAASPSGGEETGTNTAGPAPGTIATPTDAITTFINGVKAKDEAMMRSALSKATIARFEKMMKDQNKSFYEIVVGEDYEQMSQMPEMRNEKINGDEAIVEVRDPNTEEFGPIPLVKQDGNWKIALLDNAPEQPM